MLVLTHLEDRQPLRHSFCNCFSAFWSNQTVSKVDTLDAAEVFQRLEEQTMFCCSHLKKKNIINKLFVQVKLWCTTVWIITTRLIFHFNLILKPLFFSTIWESSLTVKPFSRTVKPYLVFMDKVKLLALLVCCFCLYVIQTFMYFELYVYLLHKLVQCSPILTSECILSESENVIYYACNATLFKSLGARLSFTLW